MKTTLLRAKSEITLLRRRNEILQAKVDMIELFERVLYTVPASQNYGEDIDVIPELDQLILKEESK